MLSRESALELVEASANSKGLAILVLPCVGAEGDGTITSFIVGHMVYARAGTLHPFPSEGAPTYNRVQVLLYFQ